MRKVGKSTKKGFTLVELIVVLVILAVLAAMLVPALTGYIKKARQEKEYQTAAEVLTAAQALVTEYYGKTPTSPTTDGAKAWVVGKDNSTDPQDRIHTLVGLKDSDFSLTSTNITVDSNYIVTGITVTINGANYSWNGTQWSSTAASGS